MTPERERELATQLGLDAVPKLRYDQAPDENKKLEHLVNFKKALTLVDALRTAGFERFIPDDCYIDPGMDARSFSEGMSDAVLIRTDVPPPVDPRNPTNRKVARALGIPFRLDDQAYFHWLGIELRQHYRSYGARRMAAPFVFAGRGNRKIAGAKPFIGLIMKFARNSEDSPANWGAIVPPGMTIKAANRVLAVPELDEARKIETETGGK